MLKHTLVVPALALLLVVGLALALWPGEPLKAAGPAAGPQAGRGPGVRADRDRGEGRGEEREGHRWGGDGGGYYYFGYGPQPYYYAPQPYYYYAPQYPGYWGDDEPYGGGDQQDEDEDDDPPATSQPAGQYGYLGVLLEPVMPPMADQLGLTDGRGVVVLSIRPDSPAEKAGLQQGDVVTQVNDQVIYSIMQFAKLISASKPGQKVQMTVIHKAQSKTMPVELGATSRQAWKAERMNFMRRGMQRTGAGQDMGRPPTTMPREQQ